MRGGPRYRVMALATMASLIGACASGPLDPSANRINKDLNDGSGIVTGSINKVNKSMVSALGATLPACIAYQLQTEEPLLNTTFRSAMKDITSALKEEKGREIRITALHAPRKGGFNPVAELVAMKSALPGHIRTAKIEYEPVAAKEFRSRAKCPDKETVLVVGGDIQFYRTEIPLATLSSGEMRIDSLVFLLLEDAGPRESDQHDTTTRS